MYTFTDWHKTAWDKINVDTLGEEAKRLKNEIKTLNKAVSFCCQTAMHAAQSENALHARFTLRHGCSTIPGLPAAVLL
jgi:hypothetical protein